MRKLTLATLPMSPSICGITSIETLASAPGPRVPSGQRSSVASVLARPVGLAGGVVVISTVP